MKLLSFGEILWDIYPDKKYIGGAPFNVAAHFSKLGGNSYMLSAVGSDELGNETQKKLREFNINTDFVTVYKKPTGRCLVTLNEQQIPSYNLMEDVAWDYIKCDKETKDFNIFYFGTLALRSENNYLLLERLLNTQPFEDIFVDVNIRPPFYSEESILFALEKSTLLKISTEELPVIREALNLLNLTDHNQFAKKLSALYPKLKCLILTDGANGSYAFDYTSKKNYYCPALQTTPISTVGAGDSFSAGFLYQYLNKKSLPFCLEYATKIAGFVVAHLEAIPDYDVEIFK